MSYRDVKPGTTDNVGAGFWQALAEPERLELRRAGALRRSPAGTTLFYEGDLSNVVLIILRVSVKVITNSADGRERLLAVRGCGEILGEVSAVWRIPRSATVRAIGPVEILSVPHAVRAGTPVFSDRGHGADPGAG